MHCEQSVSSPTTSVQCGQNVRSQASHRALTAFAWGWPQPAQVSS